MEQGLKYYLVFAATVALMTADTTILDSSYIFLALVSIYLLVGGLFPGKKGNLRVSMLLTGIILFLFSAGLMAL